MNEDIKPFPKLPSTNPQTPESCCWCFRNPAFTSWGWLITPLIYKVLYIPGGDCRVSSVNSSISYRFQPSTSHIHHPHPSSHIPHLSHPTSKHQCHSPWEEAGVTSSLQKIKTESLKLGGGSTNPFEKYAQVKLDHFPHVGVKIQKYLSCHHLEKVTSHHWALVFGEEELLSSRVISFILMPLPPSLHEFGYWDLAVIYFKLWNDCEEIIVCHHLSLLKKIYHNTTQQKTPQSEYHLSWIFRDPQ